MNKIEKLIKDKCPNGVEYKNLFEMTIWDKKFNGTNKKEQPRTITFKHVSAAKLKELESNVGDVKLLSTGNFDGFTTEEKAGKHLNEGEVITIPSGGSANLKYYSGLFVDSGNLLAISADVKKFNLRYIYYNLINSNEFIENNFRGSGVKHPFMPAILRMKIPIPPIEIQEEIVNILDKFSQLAAELEAELELRVKQYEFWRAKMFENKNNKKKFYLPEISINLNNKRKPVTKANRTSGEIPYYGASGIVDYVKDYVLDGKYLLISEDGANLLARNTPIAFTAEGKIWVNNHAHVIEFNNNSLHSYVEHYFDFLDINEYITGAAQPKLNLTNLNKIPIYIPEETELNYIVIILNKFDNLINNIKEGIPAEIQLRRKQYEYYRNKLLTFDELKTN